MVTRFGRFIGLSFAAISGFMILGAQTVSAQEDYRKVEIAKCILEPKNLAGFHFNINNKDKGRLADGVLTITQRIAKSDVPVSPDFQATLLLRDAKGATLTNDNYSHKHVDRLLVHQLDDALSVAFIPSGATTYAHGFLLTLDEDEAYLNSIENIAVRGPTYQTPEPVSCEWVNDPVWEGRTTPIDVKDLTSAELKKAINNYIGKRKRAAYGVRTKLNKTEAEFTAFKEGLAKEIEALHDKKACGELSTNDMKIAEDHTGTVLGYRLNVYCRGIFSEKKDKKATGTWVTQIFEGTTVYLDGNRRRIDPTHSIGYKKVGSRKWVADKKPQE